MCFENSYAASPGKVPGISDHAQHSCCGAERGHHHTAGTNVREEDRELLSEMLSSVGIGMEMQEHYMDIMTALSGGGPSFVSSYLILSNSGLNLVLLVEGGTFVSRSLVS